MRDVSSHPSSKRRLSCARATAQCQAPGAFLSWRSLGRKEGARSEQLRQRGGTPRDTCSRNEGNTCPNRVPGFHGQTRSPLPAHPPSPTVPRPRLSLSHVCVLLGLPSWSWPPPHPAQGSRLSLSRLQTPGDLGRDPGHVPTAAGAAPWEKCVCRGHRRSIRTRWGLLKIPVPETQAPPRPSAPAFCSRGSEEGRKHRSRD